MDKYLVYGDIHNRIDAAEHVASKYEDTHKIIFCGDYFDGWGDDEHIARKTANWLKRSLTRPNRIHLLGNHDAAYAFCHNSALWCPGYSPEKNRAIRSIINELDFRQLRLYYEIQRGRDERPIVISHAGFTLANLYGFRHMEYVKKGGKFRHLMDLTVDEHLFEMKKQEPRWREAAEKSGYHHFMYQGYRCGEPGHGGPYWLHMTQFTPIRGIDQIMGHTPNRHVVQSWFPNKKDSIANGYFIDTLGEEYLTIENGTINIIKYKNDKVVWGSAEGEGQVPAG